MSRLLPPQASRVVRRALRGGEGGEGVLGCMNENPCQIYFLAGRVLSSKGQGLG